MSLIWVLWTCPLCGRENEDNLSDKEVVCTGCTHVFPMEDLTYKIDKPDGQDEPQ